MPTCYDEKRERSGALSAIPAEIAVVAALMTLTVLLIPVERTSAHVNVTLLVGFIGFLLFLISKISLIKAGRISTWGPSPMRTPFRPAYFIGYGLMISSSLAALEKIL